MRPAPRSSLAHMQSSGRMSWGAKRRALAVRAIAISAVSDRQVISTGVSAGTCRTMAPSWKQSVRSTTSAQPLPSHEIEILPQSRS